MLLGSRLRKLREDAGVSRQEAAEAIRASESKICRMELGRTGPKPRDVGDLLDIYRVGEGERATLIAMARQAGTAGWWQAYSEAIPAWFAPYLGLEQAADIIRGYEVQFVPGLLQTPDYARATLEVGALDNPGLDIEQLVGLRMGRQRVLRGPRPSRLWSVIDEAALRRPVGGAKVARAQLEHLIQMSRLSHVNIQVAPLSGGSRAVADGPVTLLRFAEADLPDVVYLEGHCTAAYLSKPTERVYYWNVLNRLVTEARPPADTETLLRDILRDI
jgi:transcriptional regulator with XRE-family HTH domain